MNVKLGLVILAGLLLLASASWAQPGRGQGGRGGMHYGMMWDAKTVETITGEVVGVDRYTPGKGGTGYGLRLTVQTDRETLSVILGPAWYMEKQDLKIAVKDRVEVKGSRVTIQGQPTILAAQVKKGGKSLELRDANGVPVWAGQRGR